LTHSETSICSIRAYISLNYGFIKKGKSTKKLTWN
jgi:hypothetical protein